MKQDIPGKSKERKEGQRGGNTKRMDRASRRRGGVPITGKLIVASRITIIPSADGSDRIGGQQLEPADDDEFLQMTSVLG